LTLTETPALLAFCPPAMLATAVSKWPPFERVVVFSEKLNGAIVTAGPALAPSTSNCTLVVFAGTLDLTVIVPETVAPEAGELTETVGAAVLVGAAWLTSALAPPPQPAQSSAATNTKHNQGAAPGRSLALHTNLVCELIESSWLSLNGPVPEWFQCRYPRAATTRLRR
jgi:hypothetical protein